MKKTGITENYSDLFNMAILPSGMTEDKVHRQLCNRSTCQWNVLPSLLLPDTVHYGHHANESTFPAIGKTKRAVLVDIRSCKAEREIFFLFKGKTSIIIWPTKEAWERDEEVRGQMGNSFFFFCPLWSAALTRSRHLWQRSLIIHREFNRFDCLRK